MDSNKDTEQGNRREFPRQRSGAECTCLFPGRLSQAALVDVSCGGFKLRFDEPDIAMAVLLPVPRDVVISDENSTLSATVMWTSGALAGCRFHQTLPLEEVGRMMNGHFRLDVPCPSEQAFQERAAPPPVEPDANLEARIKAMIDADEESEANPPS